MSFNFNNIKYVIVREKLKIIKVENINDIMQCVLKYVQRNSYQAHEIMFK